MRPRLRSVRRAARLRRARLPARRGQATRRAAASVFSRFRKPVRLDDRFGEGAGRLLRQVMADATGESAMRVASGKLLRVGAGIQMRGAIRVAFERDRRHRDGRKLRELLLERIELRLAFGEPEAPAVVVDGDGDVVRVVERRRAALEGGVVELPLRRSDLPDELGELA